MDRVTRRGLLAGLSTSLAAGAGCLTATGPVDGELTVTQLTTDVDRPWGIAVVPGTDQLAVTERDRGELALVDRDTGAVTRLSGSPAVDTRGQGGLLDVTVHPSYPDEPWVYLTYVTGDTTGATTTAVGRGRLDQAAATIREFRPLFVAEPSLESTIHYGSRVTFGPDGMVYATVGDRGDKRFGDAATDHHSQVTTNALGTTLRLAPDGTVPADNPFVETPGAVDAIYSYGHRNAQGMAVRPATNTLWQSEHGEEDGDELNVIDAGGNYGWPVTHTGCEYNTDTPVGDRPEERADVVNPVHFWACGTGGFPPAGMAFYDANRSTDWQGNLFVGNLAGEYLGHFEVEGQTVTELDPLLDGRGWRIRDVLVTTDTGHMYAAVDAGGGPLLEVVPP